MDKQVKWTLGVLLTTLVMCGMLLIALALDAPTQAEIKVIAYADEHGILVSEYPQVLIDLLEQNPETEEFVLNYPFREYIRTDLSSYDRSQGVPLLMQWDPRWGYMEYSGSMVAATGSGPLCLAMTGYYLTGDVKFYPENVVHFATDQGYYAVDSSSVAALIRDCGPALGLEVKEVAAVEEKVSLYLQADMPVIAMMGSGDFAGPGHCVVVTDYRDGLLTVHDPNSYVNSGKQWDFDAFADQVQRMWVIKEAAAQ